MGLLIKQLLSSFWGSAAVPCAKICCKSLAVDPYRLQEHVRSGNLERLICVKTDRYSRSRAEDSLPCCSNDFGEAFAPIYVYARNDYGMQGFEASRDAKFTFYRSLRSSCPYSSLVSIYPKWRCEQMSSKLSSHSLASRRHLKQEPWQNMSPRSSTR